MILCQCNVLSDADIRQHIVAPDGNVRTPCGVMKALGKTPQCGCCAKTIRKMAKDILDDSCNSCKNTSCPVNPR